MWKNGPNVAIVRPTKPIAAHPAWTDRQPSVATPFARRARLFQGAMHATAPRADIARRAIRPRNPLAILRTDGSRQAGTHGDRTSSRFEPGDAKLSAERSDPGLPAIVPDHSRTTSPKAMRRWTFVIRTFTSSPTFVPGTNTTKFWIRASPSPSRPISSILASYTLPSSTGTLAGRAPAPEYDIPHSMQRPSALPSFESVFAVYNDIVGLAEVPRSRRGVPARAVEGREIRRCVAVRDGNLGWSRVAGRLTP